MFFSDFDPFLVFFTAINIIFNLSSESVIIIDLYEQYNRNSQQTYKCVFLVLIKDII